MDERLKLTKASTAAKVDATLYRSIVGGLRYLVHTRLDIAFVVGYVNRFMEDPREDHWAAVKRLLCYIKGMVDQGIVFPKTGGSRLQLTAFSDADMVVFKATHRLRQWGLLQRSEDMKKFIVQGCQNLETVALQCSAFFRWPYALRLSV
ncbi:uncharacterized mitochondrial protein AtMg00810-like [Miscanthus floridulus]|uniref:uncharacterized mitochondrial protein AtMg00810-like n=1 Tax=Miscanthus floridulus TaxID=154761 RepID=UPI003457A855